MDDSNDFAICAYDPNHKVLKARIAAHQSKCRKKYPNSKFVICPHNSTHHIHRSKMKEHLNQCIVDIGVQNLTRFANASSDDGNLNKVTAHFVSQNPEDPVDGENWETDEEHYNPLLVLEYGAYFRSTRRNCEAIFGLGDKGKKDFSDAETERIQRLQDGKSILNIKYPNAGPPNAGPISSTIEEHLKELEKRASKLPSKKTLLFLEEIKSGYMESLDNAKHPDMCEGKSVAQNPHLFMDMSNGETAKKNENDEMEFTFQDGDIFRIQNPLISKIDFQNENSASKIENNSWSKAVKKPKDLRKHSNPRQYETQSKTQFGIVKKCGKIYSSKPNSNTFRSATETNDIFIVKTDFEVEEFSRSKTIQKTEMHETQSVRQKIFKTRVELRSESEMVDGKRSKAKSKNSDFKLLSKSAKFRQSCENIVSSEVAEPGQSNNVPFQENLEIFERKSANGKSHKIGVKLNSVASPSKNGENQIPKMAKTKIKHNIDPTLQGKSSQDQRNCNKENATFRENETCGRKKKSLFKEGKPLFPSQGKPLIYNEVKEIKNPKSKDFNKAKNSRPLKNSESEQTRITKGLKVETKLEEQELDLQTELSVDDNQWQIVSRRNRKKSLKPKEIKNPKSKDFNKAENSRPLKNSESEQTRITKGLKVETKLEEQEQELDLQTELSVADNQWQIVSRRNRKKSLKPIKPNLEPMRKRA